MKTSKCLFLLFAIILLVSCSNQQTPTQKPTVVPPTQTTPFLDFDHPRLHEIAGNKSLIIDELERISIRDTLYVAVIIETTDPMLKREMLLFRVQENTSTLLYDSLPNYYMTFNIENEDHPNWLLDRYYPFVMGPLAVLVSNGGNCYDCGQILLIDIMPNGTAKEVVPDTNFTPKGFVEISGGGKASRIELVATRYYEGKYGAKVHTASPYAFRLFAYDGKTYVDVSKEEKDFYDSKIAELTSRLQETYNKPINTLIAMPILASIFFDYESSGRVEYGWEQIKTLGDLSHWDIQNTPPEEIQTYHEVFDQLERRKNQDLATAIP